MMHVEVDYLMIFLLDKNKDLRYNKELCYNKDLRYNKDLCII